MCCVKTSKQSILVLCVILSSLIYWNNKNVCTWIADIFFAKLLVAYIFYMLIQKEKYIQAFVLFAGILYCYKKSFNLGNNGKRQFYYHLVFRILVFIAFIIAIEE